MSDADELITNMITDGLKAPEPPQEVLARVRAALAMVRKHRTNIACPTEEMREQIQRLVDELSVAGFFRVFVSPACPKGQVYVFPEPRLGGPGAISVR